jgi:hypothetical protein
MKNLKSLVIVSLAAALAAALPVFAQDQTSAVSTESANTSAPAAKKAPGKKAVKKKARKKIKKAVSEYKFDKIEHIPTYKFDKKTNPIMTPPATKKKASKKSKPANKAPLAQAAAPTIPKLQTTPAIDNAGGQNAQGEQQEQGGE